MEMVMKTLCEVHNQPLHSEACNEARFEAIKEMDEYVDRWPDHCQDCHGWGGVVGSGPSLRPSSLQAKDAMECGVCLAHNKCPRCGKPIQPMPPEPMSADTLVEYLLNDHPCQHCGWNWGKDTDDAPPPIPDCPTDCLFHRGGS